MDNKIKRVLLIILTLLVLGPLVFMGSCLPLGYLGFASSFERGGTIALFGIILFYGAWIVGIVLALFIVVKVIKKINQKYSSVDQNTLN
jgi:uncharacterized membrane protein